MSIRQYRLERLDTDARTYLGMHTTVASARRTIEAEMSVEREAQRHPVQLPARTYHVTILQGRKPIDVLALQTGSSGKICSVHVLPREAQQ